MGLLGAKKPPKPEEAYNAIKSGNTVLLTELLEKKCDCNAFREPFVRAPARSTPAPRRPPPPARARTAPSARPRLRAQTGDSCLHLASNKGKDDVVRLLIEKKAEVNLQNKARRAPSARPARHALRPHRAPRAYSPRAHGAQLGQTALHCAAGYGFDRVIDALLSAGIDRSLADGEGHTALDLAKTYGQTTCVARLES